MHVCVNMFMCLYAYICRELLAFFCGSLRCVCVYMYVYISLFVSSHEVADIFGGALRHMYACIHVCICTCVCSYLCM